jgi:hypothetical protein
VALGEVQQLRREEPAQAGEFSETEWRLYLDGTQEALETADGVRVDGVDYELAGAPWEVRSPRSGSVHHTEATLRRAA